MYLPFLRQLEIKNYYQDDIGFGMFNGNSYGKTISSFVHSESPHNTLLKLHGNFFSRYYLKAFSTNQIKHFLWLF